VSDPVDQPPAPLREVPPADQFCDVVLNGGVASGVVYPWALLELARHYRFKCIGGNSVGAMAAAVAAAAEYGRCNGVADAFEPLRRFPLKLAEEKYGKTKMLRLFQPSRPVRRLFKLFLALVGSHNPEEDRSILEQAAPKDAAGAESPRKVTRTGLFFRVLWMYRVGLLLAVLLPLVVGIACRVGWSPLVAILALAACLGAVLVALVIGAVLFYRDLGALARNDYGLCTGRSQAPDEEGLVEWLHRGIQLSAGRQREDPPLTFADLWAAPRFGRAGPGPLAGGLQPPEPGINLQMFASNVTQGRPVRLPVNDSNTRLYYHPDEWKVIFPTYVMDALNQASSPYVPASRSDPDPNSTADVEQKQLMESLRELPSGGMPIVVAARLSLCFPLLFTCVPVYAVDYEAPQQKRRLRRCLLSDGGLCTNFPIHLFDAAHPRWPTFAFLLDNRLEKFEDPARSLPDEQGEFKGQAVWLPDKHLEGRADNWHRFVPGAEDEGKPTRSLLERLLGLAGGMLLTMKDWNDRVTGRLPHVRNRIIRLALQDGEGQLNLAMPKETILRMASEYGTKAGKMLVEAFAPDRNGAKQAWREHVYVRSMVELRALRRHLRGYARAAQSRGSTLPLRELLDTASRKPPLRVREDRPDPTAEKLTVPQRQAIDRAVRAVQVLEAELSACEAEFGPYLPVLEPELRLRPPV
jgi:predicted acylesterase/phospholipase RssA